MKKFLSLVLCTTLLILSSCSSDNGTVPETDVLLTETEESAVLTNVFRGTEIELPKNYELAAGILPCYNTESGTVTAFCQTGENTALVSFGTDGKLTEERMLVKGDDSFPQMGAITPDALYFLHGTFDMDTKSQSYYVMRYDLADDSRTRSDSLTSLFTQASGFLNIQSMAVDSAGYVYLAYNTEIVVLDENLQYSFTVMTDSWIEELTASLSSDGTVYVRELTGTQSINRETRMLGTMSGLPVGMDIHQYRFGNGYDLYYSDNTGLHGYNFASDEQPEAEDVLLFDYQNSDLFADNINITNIVSPDCVVMSGADGMSLTIYHRSEDIDLSEITTLEIAYVYAESTLASQIVRFNKANPDVRVITRDYSVYSTDADPKAGEKKLVNDMLNGIYTPDIVTGGGIYEDTFQQIIENGLYTDLYTLMENDPDVKKDDLLGSVRRMLESEDGRLTALTGRLTMVNTLLAPASMIGERTGWTLTEMLDFIESLPEDTILMENLTQENASFSLFGNTGYGMFIDFANGTCDFESEEFLRYLQILKTLPETAETPYTKEELREKYQTGGVALKSHYFYGPDVYLWMNMYAVFGTEDTVPVGYASTDSAVSNTLLGFTPYVITSNCEHPEEAWRFLKSVVLSYTANDLSSKGYPVLKSQFAELFETEYGTYYEIYADGTMRYFPKDVKYDPTAELTKPGFRMLFDETESAKMLDWFDNKIGLPVNGTVKTEVSDIINEEISVYLGGVRTAEDCAKVIQSRISLWLSEHQ